jgi:hypothetical protein
MLPTGCCVRSNIRSGEGPQNFLIVVLHALVAALWKEVAYCQVAGGSAAILLT